MKYNPSYFYGRDKFIADCRTKIESQDTSEEKKVVLHELISFWEDVVQIYKDYVDCYDPKEKRIRRKVLKYAVKEFKKCLSLIRKYNGKTLDTRTE